MSPDRLAHVARIDHERLCRVLEAKIDLRDEELRRLIVVRKRVVGY